VIVLQRGDDVIAWVDPWPANSLPSPGDTISIVISDITFLRNHRLADLSGPGLVLAFQDGDGNELLKINGTLAHMKTVNGITIVYVQVY
jgi:hypothetical protein